MGSAQFVKRGVCALAALSLALMLAAMFASTNRVPGQLQFRVTGFTNINGTQHMMVHFPKALHRPDRLPFGHKGWTYSVVEMRCWLGDGTLTNVVRRYEMGYGSTLRTNGPHVDVHCNFEIPAKAQLVRIEKAEMVAGSFQDVKIPFIVQSTRTVFSYEPLAE
jgi:hypothetical protein